MLLVVVFVAILVVGEIDADGSLCLNLQSCP